MVESKMIVIILKFIVNPSHKKIFIDNWNQLTDFVDESENSQGSRLNKELPSKGIGITQKMRDTCKSTEKLFKLELTEDLLKQI